MFVFLTVSPTFYFPHEKFILCPLRKSWKSSKEFLIKMWVIHSGYTLTSFAFFTSNRWIKRLLSPISLSLSHTHTHTHTHTHERTHSRTLYLYLASKKLFSTSDLLFVIMVPILLSQHNKKWIKMGSLGRDDNLKLS